MLDRIVRLFVTQFAEIRTQFDRWDELLAGFQSEAQIPEPKRKLRQSLPIRQMSADCVLDRIVRLLRQSLPVRQTSLFLLVLFLGLLAPGELPAQPPKISSTDDLTIATREYQAENFDAAIAALDRFDKASPQRMDSLDLRGCIYMEQQKFDEAKTAFERAHEAQPDVFAPRLHLGDLLLRQKKFADAREVYKTLLRETNILISHERLRFVLLLTYLGEHNEADAKEAFESIKFPTESPTYYYAQAAWAFGHDKKSEGQNWLAKAQQVYSADTMTWFAHHMYHFGWLKKKPPLSQGHA